MESSILAGRNPVSFQVGVRFNNSAVGRFEYIYCSEDETLQMRKGRVKTLQQILCKGSR